MTFFTDVVDTFYNYLEVGKVYDFCNFKIGFARKPFNTLNNEYELQCIRTCTESERIADVQLRFAFRRTTTRSRVRTTTSFRSARSRRWSRTGGCDSQSYQPTTLFRSRKGNEMNRKELVIVDSSNTVASLTLTLTHLQSIRFTVFGNNALITDDVLQSHPVIAIKSAIVSDFGGHSLSGFDSTTISLSPPLAEANQLRQWYMNNGSTNATSLSHVSAQSSMARRKTLSVIQVGDGGTSEGQDEQLGFKEKPDYLTVKVMVRSIPHDRSVVYPACPKWGREGGVRRSLKEDGRKCQKKLIQSVDGWSCESCNRWEESGEREE